MAESLIIVGAGTRAAAQSARRAGLEPVCLDVWDHRDLRAIARVHLCPIPQFPAGLLGLLESLNVLPTAKVLWTRPLENFPELLEAIAFERDLMGCTPSVVRAVRDPMALSGLPAHSGLRYCKVRTGVSLLSRAADAFKPWIGGARWLVKPRRGIGGRGIRPWSIGQPLDNDHYLQQFIEGKPISAVFLADGWSAHLVGATRQIIGDAAFGAPAFRYVGNLGPLTLDDAARRALMHLGVVLTQRFDLRGLFGIDAILDKSGCIWPVEVNPRYTESVELLEQAMGASLLGAQSMREVKQPRKHHLPPGASMLGKAVVYARKTCMMPDVYAMLGDRVGDAPEPGTRIAAGQPMATLFAAAASNDACLTLLRDQAQKVHAAVLNKH